MKYFTQGKCEFMNFIFVLLDKIKILTLKTVYFPNQLLNMLCVHLILNILTLCKSIYETPTSNFILAYFIDIYTSSKLHLPFSTLF
jgi:hypothetical protein